MSTRIVLMVMLAVAGCRKTNGAYCGNERPCGSGFACNMTTHVCFAVTAHGDMATSGGDMTPSPCGTCAPTMPICIAPNCQSCTQQNDPEGACAALSSSTPHCLQTGPDAGSCVGCRDVNDCMNPAMSFCDATSHVCRGCNSDSECPSQICDMTPGGPNKGKCTPMSDIIYVDGVGPDSNGGTTPTTAMQHINMGISKAQMLGRHYVHIAPNTYVENIVVNSGKAIILVGPSNAIIHFNNNNDALGVATGGSLTVRGLTVTSNDGNGKGGNGVGCNGATFTAYGTYFMGNLQSGVQASNCTLLLDGIWSNGNSGAGVYISAGDFQIYNSILTHNTGAGLYQMVKSATTLFVNNTVSDNTAPGPVGGVSCDITGTTAVVNSILFNNRGSGGIAETNCKQMGCANDDATGGLTATVNLIGGMPGFTGTLPLSPQSYHLTSSSVCIDKIPSTGAPDHDFDLQSRPDTGDGMIDIGADEFYP